jgi:YVTN family beta-propeller protein
MKATCHASVPGAGFSFSRTSPQADHSRVARAALWLLFGCVLWARAALPQNVTGTIGVGNSPAAIAVNPVTSTIYVVNSAGNSVSVINGATNTLTTTVTTGTTPVALAVNPLTNMVYVANNGSNNITVIDGTNNTASTITNPNGIAPVAVALNPVTNIVYVANGGSNNLTVINGANNTVVATVGGGSNPTAVVVNPATDMVYVANRSSNNVTVVNGSNNTVAATVGTGTNPVCLAVDTATDMVYAANSGSNNLTVINGASNTVAATVNTGTSPVAVTVNPVTDNIYVANNGSSSVSVINGVNNTVTATVTAGNSPIAVAADPTTNQIYVVNNASNNLTVIDGASNATVTVADPNAIAPAAVAVNPVTNTVYAANNGSDNVSVINADSNVVTTTLTTSTNPVAVGLNTVTNRVYVVNSASSTVSVIDGTTDTVVATVNTGTNPVAVAVNPATNMLYVANKGSNTVTVIDGTNNSVAATVGTGATPIAVAVDTVTNTVYVANNGSGSVTVINGANNSVATTVGVGTTPVAVAVNPATGQVYVANNGSDNITVFDPVISSNVTVTDLAASHPIALVVDSVTNKIYVANAYSDNVTVIDGTTTLVVGTINVGDTPSALALDPITNRIYVTNSGNGAVSVIDGTGLTVIALVPAGNAPSAVSVNPTSNRIYVANNGNHSTDLGSVTVIDGSSNTSISVADSNANEPYALAANPLTGEVYVANNLSSNTSVITAETIHSNPIATVIVPLTGNQTSDETPTFNFTAVNGLSAAPLDELLFQMDTWQGSWTPATPTTPGNFKGTTTTLLPGFHTVFAYATEGEEATSTVTGAQSSPLIGTIAAYGFLVATPLADVAPPALSFGNQQVGTQSSAQTVTLGNPGSAPLTFTYAVSPGDFSEGPGDTCSSAGGQLAPNSSCTIFIVFTPSSSGLETSTLTVTDNSNNLPGSIQTVSLAGTGTTTSLTLNVAEEGSGSGTVMSNPAGISCPSTCAANFSSGTSVVLTAVPNAGSTFVGWSGACSGRGTCTVTMNSNQAVTATFKLTATTSCTGTTDNWIGGASGNWSNAANWTNGVPNSSSVNVCINDGNQVPSQVTLDIAASVGSLTIDPGSSLIISNNNQLSAYGNISNAGQILVNAAANNTFLSIAGPLSLSGGGAVTFTETGTGGTAFIQQIGSQTLTNLDNTLQGAGVIGWNGLTVVNQAGGIINANAPASTLVLNPPNLTNQGLLEASAGGALQLQGNYINSGGRILSTGNSSNVQIVNAAIRGGILSSASSGLLGVAAGTSATLDGSSQGTLTIAGTYVGTNNTNTFLNGTINNTGTIQLNAAANNSVLSITGTASLAGGGAVMFTETGGGGTAFIQENGTSTLTNVNNTLQGAGVIGWNGLTVVNQAGGIINGNAPATTLLLNSPNLTNQGLLEATAGGTLQLQGNYINSGGRILSTGSNSNVQIVNASIRGGTLSSANSGLLGVAGGTSATLDGSSQGTLTIAGTYVGANNTNTFLNGTINNTGVMQLNAAVNNALLSITGAASLTGGGTVMFTETGGGGTAFIQQNGTSTLTNVNNTLQGAGVIGWNGLSVVNQGTINANLPAEGSLLLNPGGFLNQGMLEATVGGTLVVSSSTINNAAGTIKVNGATSTVQFVNGATIQGGTLATANNGVLTIPSGNSIILDGITQGSLNITGTYVGANNTNTLLKGTINNSGAIQVNAAANNTLLSITGTVSLTGGGMVMLTETGTGGSAAIQQNGTSTLTNVSNSLQGAGVIGWNGLNVVNQGTINANLPAEGTLTINGGFTNAGLLEATVGGTLVLSSSTISNGAGTINVNGATSTVQFVNGATIQGGTLATANGGILTIPAGNSITLDGSSGQGTLTVAGAYVGANNTTTFLKGTINNMGAMQVNATANNTFLAIGGPVSLTGNGTVTLTTTGVGGTAAIEQSGGNTLTNVGNTLQGTGVIGWNGLSVVNQGTIDANASSSLVLNPGGFTNQGVLEATGVGMLQVSSSVSNAGGSIVANGASAAVQFANGITIQGGTLNGVSGGFVGSSSGNVLNVDGTANPVSIAAGATYTVGNNSTTDLFGTINNNGTLLLDSTGNNTTLNAASGGATLAGAGSVMMTSGPNMFLGTSLLNGGNIILDSATFNVSSYMQNAGLFQIAATGSASSVSFSVNGGTAQVDGTLATSQGVSVTGSGTLSGNGTIVSNVSMAGVTEAGDIPNPGILTIGINGVGSYTQSSAGAYDVVIGGLTAGTQYSQLNVPGAASISGTLNVSLIDNFVPAAGNQFVVLTAGALSNQFVTTNLPALPPNLSWTVNYTGTQVVLSVMASNSNFTLTVTTLGTGNGSVTDNFQQINCVDTAGVQLGVCSASYESGTTVNLTATPIEPTTFGGWGGACSGTEGCSVLMNANQSVTAAFVPQPVTMSAPFTCPNGVYPCQNVTAPPAVFNCPSGKDPCPDPNAHSLALTAAQVNTAFTMTVAATEVPMTQADGDCQFGQTPATDFDCRFTSFFPYETLSNGDIIVPACDAYSAGDCVFYSVYFGNRGIEPPTSDYDGPISWSIAWNNTSFLPNPNYPYQINNPRLYDDPDYEVSPITPYGTNCNTPMLINGIPTMPPIYCQFVFDITTYFDPNQPPDAGIGGKTKQFNDVVVAFPLTIAPPSLSVTKVADETVVNAGSPIGYTVTMSNSPAAGTGTATNTTLNDPLPTGTNISWSINPPYSGPGTCTITEAQPPAQRLFCSFGNISPAISASVHVLSLDSSVGTYVNTATLAASNSSPQMASATIQVVNGSGPIATVSPSKLNFPNVYLRIPNEAFVTLANTGNAPMSVGTINITAPGNDLGDFRAKSLCPKTLAAGQACKIMIICRPTGDNYSPTATLAINDNAPGSPQMVPLSATVINPEASVSPKFLNFGIQQVGTTSPPQTVTLTNSGTTPLLLRLMTITGNFAFASGTTCSNGTMLAPNAQCVINVTFTPKGRGKRIGCVELQDNALFKRQKVQLSGMGD